MNTNTESISRIVPINSPDLLVELTHEGAVGVVRTTGVCTRRTDHGFEAEVPAVLCVGEEVEAELRVSGRPEPVRAPARVIYRNRNRYGFFLKARYAFDTHAQNQLIDTVQ